MGFRKKFIIKRTSGGDYDDNGIWQKGETEEIEIMASVQPISLDEYNQIFPEGIRTVNAVKIYTDTRLYPENKARQRKMLTCFVYGQEI